MTVETEEDGVEEVIEGAAVVEHGEDEEEATGGEIAARKGRRNVNHIRGGTQKNCIGNRLKFSTRLIELLEVARLTRRQGG